MTATGTYDFTRQIGEANYVSSGGGIPGVAEPNDHLVALLHEQAEKLAPLLA